MVHHLVQPFPLPEAVKKHGARKKKFREGQAEQVLDTLFFDFIDLAKKPQPKVVVAENVKGLLIGEAKDYVRRIYDGFEEAGYYCQHWLLDAQYMGVPQRRERAFFVCLRKDIANPFLVPQGLFDVVPALNLDFHEKPIMFGEVADFRGREANSKTIRLLWDNRQYGDLNQGARMKDCLVKAAISIRRMCIWIGFARPLQAKNHV